RACGCIEIVSRDCAVVTDAGDVCIASVWNLENRDDAVRVPYKATGRGRGGICVVSGDGSLAVDAARVGLGRLWSIEKCDGAVFFPDPPERSEEHTSELQSLRHLVCRLLLEKKKKSIWCSSINSDTLQPFNT